MTDASRVISAAALQARLEDPSVRILEVSASADAAGYRSGHIPGARWAYWKTLLWDERMRAFPSAQESARRLGELGLGGETTLVLYGDPLQYGTYALWALSAAGQRDVLVLDGGKEHWAGAGHPLTSAQAAVALPTPRPHRREDRSQVIGRDGVLAAIGDPDVAIVDFRSPEEYAGERVSPYAMAGGVDHGAERTGRIPGARHLFYRELLNDDWTFRDATELLATAARQGIAPEDRVIGYCRLAHRASLGWVALGDLAGFSSVRVYDGSWTEWGSIVGVPIER
jgi:thiosulfate/3-mercaptopyruvate sulfurtransferase